MSSLQVQSSGHLNEAQRRRLSVTCEYIDNLLCDIEHVLHEEASPSPFPRHVVDVTPEQATILEDHIRRIRAELVRALEWQQLKPHPPNIPATRAMLTNLSFIDIAIEELKPHYMRGAGAVAEDVAGELNGVVRELHTVAQDMQHYIRRELRTRPE